MEKESMCRWIPDVDGFTSAAIMHKFITDNSDCNVFLGIHAGKEHGLDLEQCLSFKPDLVIVPDASGNPNDYVYLKQKEIKSCIIDHHLYPESDFDTLIVNCNYKPYPNPHLSGAGVALKVCQYYASKFKIDYDFSELYSLAAIGMIADVMSLQELENQYIIRKGLKGIKRHEFFNELLKDHMGKPINIVTIKDIGWTIGPNLNSVIRLGTPKEKGLLFETIIEPRKNIESEKRGAKGEIVPLYEEMVRICKNLKAKQNRMVQNAIKIIEPTINLQHNLIYYIDQEGELPFELSGLIANKLLGEYQRPVLILKHFHDYANPSEPDCWAGSVRSLVAEGFEDPRQEMENFSGTKSAQGHKESFGLKVYKESFDSFLAEAYDKLDHIDFNNQFYTVEAEMPVKSLDNDIAKVFAHPNIWGSGLTKPLIKLNNIDCIGAMYMGTDAQHVKIMLPKIDIVVFNNEELVEIFKESKQYEMEAIGELGYNEWDGQQRLQLIVKDYSLSPKKNTEWSIYDF